MESGLWNTMLGRLLVVMYFSVFNILACFFLLARMSKEDTALRNRFGKQWDDWAKSVPYSIFPGMSSGLPVTISASRFAGYGTMVPNGLQLNKTNPILFVTEVDTSTWRHRKIESVKVNQYTGQEIKVLIIDK